MYVALSMVDRPHAGDAAWYWWIIAFVVYAAIGYLLWKDNKDERAEES